MKNRIRLMSLIFNQPQLATHELMMLATQWANESMNLNITNIADESGVQMSAAEDRRRALVSETGVDIIPVYGVLVARSLHMTPCETMTSYERIRARVSQAAQDSAVSQIVLDIDSTGGSVMGAFELAEDIRAAAQIKPITAIANFSAYSAAYLIAAAASEIVVSATSGVGSIGVIARHLDVSRRDDQQGVKITTVFAGGHKNDLSPHEPITDQALSALSGHVNLVYEQFADAVSRYRGLTTDAIKNTNAALFFGGDSVKSRLADRVESPQAAINRIAEAARGPKNSAARRIAIQAAAIDMAERSR